MCGGDTNRASRQAEANERERQLAVRDALAAIDRAFLTREPGHRRFLRALRDEYGTQVARQKARTDRQLRFALARSGLTGGSGAVDAYQQLGEEHADAVLQAERQAQNALARLRGADEAARADLTRLAQSGVQATTAASQAANALRANLAQAESRSLVQGLGDLFGRTRALYDQQREDARYRAGLERARRYGNPFGGTR